jgi:hypothetical protein
MNGRGRTGIPKRKPGSGWSASAALGALLDELPDIGSRIQEFLVDILQDISPVVCLEMGSVTADAQLAPFHDVFRDQEMNTLVVIRDREGLIAFAHSQLCPHLKKTASNSRIMKMTSITPSEIRISGLAVFRVKVR